ncbi:MAG: sortase [Candidatus Peribacteraceae bacterium]|nr:sortase [Candidatus Peribacteraceae bacterium]
MIAEPNRRHQARYDKEGNIILPSSGEDAPEVVNEEPNNEWSWQYAQTWETTEEPKVKGRKRAKAKKLVGESVSRICDSLYQCRQSVHGKLTNAAKEVVKEGKHQCRWTLHGTKMSLKCGRKEFRNSTRQTWAFLTQPVWIPRKNKEPKETSRMKLFLVDTIRFGGTFATIFVALFVALNYQSFIEIAATHIKPLQHARAVNALTDSVNTALREKLMKSPTLAVAGGDDGNLLSFLPAIGPPENRLIVPKLGLNIPLVTPSYDSLLREDWIQVEKDIQEALALGVVHYPGTAKPGQAGNFFVTGHSSYYPWATGKFKTVFARLPELEPGDEYWIYYGGDKHRYIVRSKKEVRPSDVTVLDQPIDRRIATLMTCTPIGTTLRRLVVSAEEVDPQTGIAMEVGDRGSRPRTRVKTEMLPI